MEIVAGNSIEKVIEYASSLKKTGFTNSFTTLKKLTKFVLAY